jgi:hypothetical protein
LKEEIDTVEAIVAPTSMAKKMISDCLICKAIQTKTKPTTGQKPEIAAQV